MDRHTIGGVSARLKLAVGASNAVMRLGSAERNGWQSRLAEND